MQRAAEKQRVASLDESGDSGMVSNLGIPIMCIQIKGVKMKSEKVRIITFEIFTLSAVIAKTTLHATKRYSILAEKGLSMLQYGVLRALHTHDLTIAELSKFMMVDPSTLVSVIDTLSRKGLAERKCDPNDRRRIPIAITEKGEVIISEHPNQGPFAAEDNPLIQSLELIGEDKAEQLRMLPREVVSYMPDGDEILQHVQKRVHFQATGQFVSPQKGESSK